MGRKIDVLIEITDGIIVEVAVLPKDKAKEVWEAWGKEHGYATYQDFIIAVQTGEANTELRWFNDFDIDEGFKKKKFNPSVRQQHEAI
jgi:hypothetical protein